jgi:hypothetical protein
MRTTTNRIGANLCVLGVFLAGISACSSATDGTNGGTAGTTGMAGAKASGGAPGSAGSVATSGSAGANLGGGGASAGSPGSAGLGQGGTPAAGGSLGAAGASTAGGGSGSGGKSGSGGMSSVAGASAGGSTSSAGSTGSGGSSSGTCTKGQTKGNQVAVIGESFIAMTHGITQEIEKQAKANGSLGQSEKYVDNSVSGTLLSGSDANAIPNQYKKAAQGGMIKYVLMDGGGNDCLQANNGDAALAAAQALFPNMAKDGVEKVVYFFYPDPLGSFSSGTLKTCLDALRPKMKALCDGLTAPKCYWMDLRTLWNGHSEYTSDGIHPTAAGSVATGDAIWEVMKTNCVAQ